jgi:flagellum-specific peptidoglycan hydrolase FlgJ
LIKVISLVTLFISGIANYSSNEEAAANYIESYNELAVIEMYRSGVPASITIAQALLESNYGTSPLAVEANNHFGIKCKNYWTGIKYFHKDDDLNTEGELIESCFRAYENVFDSYVDHSNFLMMTPHYRHLFDLSQKDYVNWAIGLKKAGYATDPNYAKKLIRFIERYELNKLDEQENPFKKVKNLTSKI